MPRQKLTDDEGTLLALVLRLQPVKAYEIARIYKQSPVKQFTTSKGNIYPLIKRVSERGLLRRDRVETDARGTEFLSCTGQGREAVRDWVLDLKPAHMLVEDPLRTKVERFDLLTRDEQVEWILHAKESLEKHLEQLDSYNRSVTVPFAQFVQDNALRSMHARMAWLDSMLACLLREQGEV